MASINSGAGVDACNTFLEVLLFAAAINMGQNWYTVLVLFGCEFSVASHRDATALTERDSNIHILYPNVG